MRCVSPWYNRTSWLGVKHQLTYLLDVCVCVHAVGRKIKQVYIYILNIAQCELNQWLAGIFLVEFQQAGQVKPEHLTLMSEWCSRWKNSRPPAVKRLERDDETIECLKCYWCKPGATSSRKNVKIPERVLLPLVTLFLCKTTWVIVWTHATSVDRSEAEVSVTSEHVNVSAGSGRHSRQLEIWESWNTSAWG